MRVAFMIGNTAPHTRVVIPVEDSVVFAKPNNLRLSNRVLPLKHDLESPAFFRPLLINETSTEDRLSQRWIEIDISKKQQHVLG